jgi:fucose permease
LGCLPGNAGFGIVMLSLGTINIFIAEQFKDSNPDIASLAVFLPLGIFIGRSPSGRSLTATVYKNLLIFCILLIAGGIEGIAYAADFRLVQLSFFIIGLGGGVINGGTNALVADISDTERRQAQPAGRFFRIRRSRHAGVVGFLQNYFSFLTIIKVIGLIIFLTIVYFLLIRFPEAKQKTRNSSVNGFKLLKSPLLLLIGLILFFESGIEGLMNNWTALYLSSHLQTAPDATLYALSFIVIGMTGMRLILGFTLKYIRDHLMLYGSYGLILIGTVIVMFVPSYTTILVGLTMIGAGFAAVFPILLGYVGNLFAEASGTAFSIVFGIALIGNMLINAAVGIVNRHFGIQYYLVVLLVGLIFQVLFFTIIAKKITTKVNA